MSQWAKVQRLVYMQKADWETEALGLEMTWTPHCQESTSSSHVGDSTPALPSHTMGFWRRRIVRISPRALGTMHSRGESLVQPLPFRGQLIPMSHPVWAAGCHPQQHPLSLRVDVFAPLKCPINQERGPAGDESVGQSSASCGRSFSRGWCPGVAEGRERQTLPYPNPRSRRPLCKGPTAPSLVIAPIFLIFFPSHPLILTWNSEYSQFIPGPFSSFLWCHVSLTWPLPDPRPLPKAVEPTLEGTGIRFSWNEVRGDPNGTTVGGYTTHHGLVPIWPSPTSHMLHRWDIDIITTINIYDLLLFYLTSQKGTFFRYKYQILSIGSPEF